MTTLLRDASAEPSWSNPCDFWPDEEDRLLLEAILGDAPQAAWEAWREGRDLSAQNHGVYQLFPMMHDALNRANPEHPDLDLLRSVQKQTWYRNRILYHRLRAFAEILDAKKIPYLFLKGPALLAAHYRDFGLRPMNDWDLLISHQDAEPAMAAAEAHGMRPLFERRRRDLLFYPGQGYEHPAGAEIDLHWRPMPGRLLSDDPELWRRARTVAFEGYDYSMPGPEDLLLHVLVHGLEPNPVLPVRWVVDAVTLLNGTAPDDFDWAYFQRKLRRRGLRPRLDPALALIAPYLKDGVQLPARVLRATGQRAPVIGSLGTAPGPLPLVDGMRTYLRISCDNSFFERLRILPAYLRHAYGLEDGQAVLSELLKRAGARLKRVSA